MDPSRPASRGPEQILAECCRAFFSSEKQQKTRQCLIKCEYGGLSVCACNALRPELTTHMCLKSHDQSTLLAWGADPAETLLRLMRSCSWPGPAVADTFVSWDRPRSWADACMQIRIATSRPASSRRVVCVVRAPAAQLHIYAFGCADGTPRRLPSGVRHRHFDCALRIAVTSCTRDGLARNNFNFV